MSASPRIIITADDFGYTSAHNRGIADSFRQGLITHASLMVNMPATAEAGEYAATLGVGDRVGCHLNLAEGPPLTERIRKSRAFCADGVFTEPLTRPRFHPLSYDDRHALAEETRAQIAAVRRFGCAGLHLDSHRYVHTIPNVAGVVADVAREMRVDRVRPYVNCGPTAKGPKRLAKAAFNWWLSTRGFVVVDRFGSIDDVREIPARAREALAVEIMVHPLFSADLNVRILDGGAGPLLGRLAELDAHFGAGALLPAHALRYDR